MRIVLATRNDGKLKELGRILAPLGFELISQAQLDVPSPVEDGLSFIENALIKARHVSQATDLPAIADDSGIVLPCLDGAPGIHSARYAGEAASDADNNRLLISTLTTAGLLEPPPAAYFYCAMVFLEHALDPTPIVATAAWAGRVTGEPRGVNGFGYDPHFLVGDGEQTSAELPGHVKNDISHRAQASRALMVRLKERYAP